MRRWRAGWHGYGRAALIAVVAGVLAGPGWAADGLQKIKALIPVRSIDEAFAPFPVAKRLGYFQAEGLDVDLLPVGGSNEVALQMAGGNGDVGMASPAQALISMQPGTGLDTKYFYDLYYRNIWSISVTPDSPIATVADLKGKKLGVQAMGSAGITYGSAYLTAAGLDPKRDISFLPIGSGAQAMTAVRQHLVDAIVFWDAALAKFEVGGLKLRQLPIDPKLAGLPDVSMLARQGDFQKRRPMLIGFARAVAKAYDFTMANPEAAVRITWALYPETKPPGDSAAVLRDGILVNQSRMAIWDSPKAQGKHGLFIAEDWSNLVAFMVAEKMLAAPVPLDRIYTTEMIDAINDYDRAAVIAAAKAFNPTDLK